MNRYENQAVKTFTISTISDLPNQCFTRSGISFNPNEDVWHWVDGPFKVYLSFNKLDTCLPEIRESLKNVLSIFAKGSSASHVVNLFNVFKHFINHRLESNVLHKITIQELSDYRSILEKHERWRFGTLSVLIQKWELLESPGLDTECGRYLRGHRKEGNEKGNAVRTRDPVTGPFSESEFTSIYKTVDAAYGEGRIPTWAVILTRLLFACGGRISQYASLKMKDFETTGLSFSINLPQAKTREKHSRMSFYRFDLSPQTGRLIAAYIENKKRENCDGSCAMFPETEVRNTTTSRPANDIFSGHCTNNDLSKSLSKILNSIAPASDRLDFGPIPINPLRFRYTFGTRLAEEGASRVVIARVLGHVDLQNVDVYFAASPKIVKNIDKALHAQLLPLANAFRGRLIEGESDSTHKGAPGSKIIDFRVSQQPVGSCGGKGKGCEFNKPIACYTCFKFEPWLDAPHEKVLIRLIEERAKFVSDERVAAVNDQAILAIQQVMQECIHAKKQMHEEKLT